MMNLIKMIRQNVLHSICALLTVFIWSSLSAQSVGINTDGSAPDASSMLDIKHASKGILIPRVALTGTGSASPITTPATALMVYNTATVSDVTPGYYYWTGSAWTRMLSGTLNYWSLTGNSGTTPGTNFLGTTDGQDLVFKANGTERMRLLQSNGNFGVKNNNPTYDLDVTGNGRASGLFYFGTSGAYLSGTNQGGSIELGPANSAGGEMPFIDFHFGVGSAQDYNARIINDANGRLNLLGNIRINGSYNLPASDGSSSQVLTTDGSGTLSWVNQSGAGPVGTTYYAAGSQTFTHGGGAGTPTTGTSHSWTVPAGVKTVRVQLTGGGGGGGYNGTTETSGACAGVVIGELAVTPGESLTIYVGAGGTGYGSGTNAGKGGTGSYVERSGTKLCGAGGGGGGASNGSTDGNGGGAAFGTSLNGGNGGAGSGGSSGNNYVAYLHRSEAYRGRNSVAAVIGQSGYVVGNLTAFGDNSYGEGGRWGNGEHGVVVLNW